MKTLLIAGTDTDVGKTVVTTAIAAYLQTYPICESWGLMKLMQTGIGDRELYHQLFQLNQELQVTAPVHFKTPVAPPVAAEQEGHPIDLGKVWHTLTQLQSQHDFVLVEALGGLGTPVTHELTVADLAGQWRLKVVLVVPVKLGAIAQTVANVALARQRKVTLQGIILNCPQPLSEEEITELAPISLIESLTQVPILGVVPYLKDAKDLKPLAQVASNLDLERLLRV